MNSKSIPMSLERACALKAEMKKDPRLWAVNNLRVFGNHGAWKVDATLRDFSGHISMRCESDWEDWLSLNSQNKD